MSRMIETSKEMVFILQDRKKAEDLLKKDFNDTSASIFYDEITQMVITCQNLKSEHSYNLLG